MVILNSNTLKYVYNAYLNNDVVHEFDLAGQFLFVASQEGILGLCVVIVNSTPWRTDFTKIADSLQYQITFEGKSSGGTFIPWTASWGVTPYAVRIYKL